MTSLSLNLNHGSVLKHYKNVILTVQVITPTPHHPSFVINVKITNTLELLWKKSPRQTRKYDRVP